MPQLGVEVAGVFRSVLRRFLSNARDLVDHSLKTGGNRFVNAFLCDGFDHDVTSPILLFAGEPTVFFIDYRIVELAGERRWCFD